MNETAPHYLLFTEAKDLGESTIVGGRWRFVLEEIGSETRIEESENEPGVVGERLQLLVVVRGLESLHQPSRVTLITPSKYVGRGIRMSLSHWRENNWQWESFGNMTPIKHHDLWQRIDHAMSIHDINCRVWQFDPPHVRTQTPLSQETGEIPATPSNRSPATADTDVEDAVPPKSIIRFKSNHCSREAEEASTVTMSKSPTNHDHSSIQNLRVDVPSTCTIARPVTTGLAERVKPIGEGRAYGHVIY